MHLDKLLDSTQKWNLLLKLRPDTTDRESACEWEGEPGSFSQFEKGALTTHDLYNVYWLHAEQPTILQGQAAAKCQRYTADAALFLLIEFFLSISET